jgi:serine/threonine-protein kinase RsbW
VPNPLTDENILKPGGRGIFLINELMDEVAFADGGREVQMRKRQAPPSKPNDVSSSGKPLEPTP